MGILLRGIRCLVIAGARTVARARLAAAAFIAGILRVLVAQAPARATGAIVIAPLGFTALVRLRTFLLFCHSDCFDKAEPKPSQRSAEY